MHLPFKDPVKGAVNFRFLAFVFGLFAIPFLVSGAAPSWWFTSTPPVISGTNANDYAAVNQGQVKNIAKAAVAEFDLHLPGGAGAELHALVESWETPSETGSNYSAVNVGQLKALGRPFYDRLIAVGYTTAYPWFASSTPSNDYAMANIGQVKNLFSFDLMAVDTLHDADINGLADWWELFYFGHTGNDPNAFANDGMGLTIAQEALLGINPTSYNAGSPTLAIESDDNPSAKPGERVHRPGIVKVTGSNGTPLVHAPVRFTVVSGSGALYAGNNPSASATNTHVSVTDGDGFAQIYFRAPSTLGDFSEVTALAASTTVNFSLNSSLHVAQWEMDEGSGTSTQDRSGMGNHGATVGAPSWTVGYDGESALLLNGTNQYSTVPDSPSLQFGEGEVTFTAWVKLENGSALFGASDWYPIISKGTTYPYFALCLRGGSYKGLYARVNDVDIIPYVDQSSKFNDNQWHQVAFVRRSSGNAEFYIDGELVGSSSGVTASFDNAAVVNLGRLGGSSFKGGLQKVNLFAKALSLTELRGTYDIDRAVNGLPDGWELEHFGYVGVDPDSPAPSGGGFTIRDAYTLGFDPNTPLSSVADAVITPGSRRLSGPFVAHVSTITTAASLRYTVDGTEPTLDSLLVPLNGEITISKNTILKVKGFKQASPPVFAPSNVVTRFYLIGGLLDGGSDFSILRTLGGKVLTWGKNGVGQLGISTFVDASAPHEVESLIGAVLTGAAWETAAAVDGNGTTFTWGSGFAGQLGSGSEAHSSEPLNIGQRNFTRVSGGQHHMMAIAADGTVWGWGGNQVGQLGITSGTSQMSPLQIPEISNASDVKTGAAFSLVLLSDGSLLGWGDNQHGQLGSPLQNSIDVPKAIVVGTAPIRSIATGAVHSLALDSNGDVYAWGANWNGQLGTGLRVGTPTPSRVSGLPKIIFIAAGKYHSLAISEEGGLYVWGANWSGQIGNGTFDDQLVPVELSVSNVVDTAGGISHSAAITADGKVWAWGDNSHGQLGRPGLGEGEPIVVDGINILVP